MSPAELLPAERYHQLRKMGLIVPVLVDQVARERDVVEGAGVAVLLEEVSRIRREAPSTHVDGSAADVEAIRGVAERCPGRFSLSCYARGRR